MVHDTVGLFCSVEKTVGPPTAWEVQHGPTMLCWQRPMSTVIRNYPASEDGLAPSEGSRSVIGTV